MLNDDERILVRDDEDRGTWEEYFKHVMDSKDTRNVSTLLLPWDYRG